MSIWQTILKTVLVFLTPFKNEDMSDFPKITPSLSPIPFSKNSCSLLSLCRNSKQYPLSFNQLGVFSDAIVLQYVHSNVSLSTKHRHLDKNRRLLLKWKKTVRKSTERWNVGSKHTELSHWTRWKRFLPDLVWKPAPPSSHMAFPLSPPKWITLGKCCKVAI